ncbi:MAG TPA: hypothetical protein VMK65_08465, partial [Longimicrobiales bacterium]|nr:hypothetical protein [Longimicrobiales bacterium]
IRSMAGPALLGRGLERPGRLERLLLGRDSGPLERALTSEVAARVLPLLAAGEMIADKLPWIPARTDPLPLLGRAALGAMAGAVVGRRAGSGTLLPAAMGAAAAVAVASMATALRRRADEMGVPDMALGLLEDGAVLAAGAALANALE